MPKKLNIGIITADSNGAYPVPAVNGGAVPTLIENLVKDNTQMNLVNFTVFSFYSKKAFEDSKKYKNTNFIWIKVPSKLKKFDKIVFNKVKNLKKIKAISYKSIFSLLYYIFYVSKYLRTHAYIFDKLVLENNIPIAWIIRLSKYKGEYYYHFHNIPRINAGCKNIFQKCNGFLCVSQYLAKIISSPKNPIGPINYSKIHILYNSIDTGLFSIKKVNKSILKEKYHISRNEKVILFVGRLNKQKGLDILIDSIKLIKNLNIKLIIVGSLMYGDNDKDNYIKSLKEKIKSISDKVIFTGYISQKNLPYLYNMADVAVLPSLWGEAAGLTMIEAMSCGLPVITTNCGGIPEYVDHKSIVLKIDKNLSHNIAESIKKMIFSRDIKKQEYSNYVNKKFSNSDYLYKFIKFLH